MVNSELWIPGGNQGGVFYYTGIHVVTRGTTHIGADLGAAGRGPICLLFYSVQQKAYLWDVVEIMRASTQERDALVISVEGALAQEHLTYS